MDYEKLGQLAGAAASAAGAAAGSAAAGIDKLKVKKGAHAPCLEKF